MTGGPSTLSVTAAKSARCLVDTASVALKFWFVFPKRSTSREKRVREMTETLVREGLVFGGAVLGAIWGYTWGRTAEYRRWQAVLEGLESLRLRLNDTLSLLDRLGKVDPQP